MKIAALLVAAQFVLFAGCSRKEEAKIYPISGTVRLDGSPLVGASIMLQPVDGGIYGYGISGEDGAFTISTYEIGDGAIPGEHRIIVSMQGSQVFPGGEPGDEDDSTGEITTQHGTLIPEKYTDAETSGLSVVVSADSEPLILELESQ